jgi:ADP-ribose pyrophosphatase
MVRDLRETCVKTQVVFEGVFLKVRKDLARLPDGSLGVREYVEHPGAAAMVPLFDDGRILIERQFRYGPNQVFVEIPAGKLDPGEVSLQTAKRELLEETGHIAGQWALMTRIHPTVGFASEIIDIFVCKDLTQKTQQLDPGEFVELDIVTLGWLIDEIRAGRLTDVKTQIAVHWLDRLYSGQWPWPQFEPA